MCPAAGRNVTYILMMTVGRDKSSLLLKKKEKTNKLHLFKGVYNNNNKTCVRAHNSSVCIHSRTAQPIVLTLQKAASTPPAAGHSSPINQQQQQHITAAPPSTSPSALHTVTHHDSVLFVFFGDASIHLQWKWGRTDNPGARCGHRRPRLV